MNVISSLQTRTRGDEAIAPSQSSEHTHWHSHSPSGTLTGTLIVLQTHSMAPSQFFWHTYWHPHSPPDTLSGTLTVFRMHQISTYSPYVILAPSQSCWCTLRHPYSLGILTFLLSSSHPSCSLPFTVHLVPSHSPAIPSSSLFTFAFL